MMRSLHSTLLVVIALFLYECRQATIHSKYPLLISVTEDESWANHVNSLMVCNLPIIIKNIDKKEIYLGYKQFRQDTTKFLFPDYYQGLVGNIDNLRPYPFGRSQAPGRLHSFKDTIAPGEEKNYFLDSFMQPNDSIDFLIISLDIRSPYFDSLNNMQKHYYLVHGVNGPGSMQLMKHPFWILQHTKFGPFSDVTDEFIDRYPDLLLEQ